MASRIVSQQHRGEGVPVENKQQQKKNGVGDGRNRQALGDIGNCVAIRGTAVDGKPLPPINRPVTRSFCAQLLANAQAAAAAENNNKEKPNPVNLDGAVADAKRVAKPPQNGVGEGRNRPALGDIGNRQKKLVVKLKPAQAVVEMIPEKKETAKKEEAPLNTKKARQGSSRRKVVPTLTSVLTARSKYACGIKDRIPDIDAADAENELAAVEYVEDMYKFYKEVENESQLHDYIDSQPEINEKMRAILVDWLIEVHNKFELRPETLYLTINIIDRFLSKKLVPRKQLQLVGISAMLIASKYEEIWAPEVDDFVCISDRAYTHVQVLQMEKALLGELEWTLTVPTMYVFLVRFIKAASAPDNKEMKHLVYFLAELGTMNYVSITMYCPSMIAASAVYAARLTLNMTPVWNATLQLHTGYSERQLSQCARLLVSFHQMSADNKLKASHKKYSDSEMGSVALLTPTRMLFS